MRELGKSDERRKLRGAAGRNWPARRRGRKRDSSKLEQEFPLGPAGAARSVAPELQVCTLVGKKSPETQKSSERNRVMGGLKKAGRQGDGHLPV